MAAKLKDLGLTRYEAVLDRMRAFTEARDAATQDEFWTTEHQRVFTQGQAGRAEHVLAPGDIPIVQSDRGGQVTYHGPGQLVLYTLVDLKRIGAGPRTLVSAIENAVIDLLSDCGIEARARADAPGVYVEGAKVAALGLRVRRGRSYHGLSLNVDMDLTPFSCIDPCGMRDLPVTQLRDLGGPRSVEALREPLAGHLARHLYG